MLYPQGKTDILLIPVRFEGRMWPAGSTMSTATTSSMTNTYCCHKTIGRDRQLQIEGRMVQLYCDMKAHGGVDAYMHILLTPALVAGK
jgi:hypothetical protein